LSWFFHQELSRLRPLLPLAGAMLLIAADQGPDFGSYTDWAAAALSGDIFALRGNVLSPGGVPFMIAAPGAGLLFALGKVVLFPLTLAAAALASGWVAAVVFWACAFIVIRRMAGGSDLLTAFGAGTLFIGTHAGLYSHAYATEVFANALIAALWAFALTRERWRLVDAAVVGALTGMLLLVRAHVAVYALPALWAAVSGTSGMAFEDGPAVTTGAGLQPRPGRRADIARLAQRLAAVAMPLAIAAVEYGVVNRWMTGSVRRPPYLYGGNGFTSVDLAHPQVAAILVHPWHGLLAYHPLFGVAFVALVLEASRRGRWRALWAATLVALIAHVWVQAAWWVWWLGGTTFGMRGLAPAAFPMVAALVATIRRQAATDRRRASLWIGATTVACAWSYPLLLSGNTQFVSWSALLRAQMPVLVALAVSGGVLVVAGWRGFNRPPIDRLLLWLASIFAAAIACYLFLQASQVNDPLARSAAALAAAIVLASCLRVAVVDPRWVVAAFMTAVIGAFVAQAALFARLAVRTEMRLASGAPPPRPFRFVGAAPVDESRASYAEYLEVPGFDREKAAVRRYLQWQWIDASRLSPDDRRIADAVRLEIERDELFADRLVALSVRDGVVEMAAPGMTAAQQSRARELALNVPGARAVTFLPE
jgi:hypothetical protein